MSWRQIGDKRDPIDLRFDSGEKKTKRLFPSSTSSAPSAKWMNHAAAEELKSKDIMTDRPFQLASSSFSSSGGRGIQFSSSSSSNSRPRSNNNDRYREEQGGSSSYRSNVSNKDKDSPDKPSERIEKRREYESLEDDTDWLDTSLSNRKTTARPFAMDFQKLKQKEKQQGKERFLNVMSYGGFDSSTDPTPSRIKKRKQFDEDLDEVTEGDLLDEYLGPNDSKSIMRGVSPHHDDDFEDDGKSSRRQQGGKPRRKKPNQSSADTLHSAVSGSNRHSSKAGSHHSKHEEESEWIDTTSISVSSKDKPLYDVWNKPNQQKELKASSSSYSTVENKEWERQLKKMKQEREQARADWLAKQAQKGPSNKGGNTGLDALQYLGGGSDTLYAQGGTEADLDPLEDPNHRASDFAMPVGMSSFDPYSQKGNSGTTALPPAMPKIEPFSILAMMRKNQQASAEVNKGKDADKDDDKDNDKERSVAKRDWGRILNLAQKTRQVKITTSLEQIDLGPLVQRVLGLDLLTLLQKSQKIHQEKDDMDVALDVENYDAAHNLILTDVKTLKSTQLRYMDENMYNSVFEPLLIEESCAAIVSQMRMDDNRSKKHHSNNKNNNGESAPKYDMAVERKCVQLESVRVKRYVTSRHNKDTSPRDGSPAVKSDNKGELVTLEATPSLTSMRQRGYFPPVPSLSMDEMCILMKDQPNVDPNSKEYYKTLLSTPHVLGLISKSKQKILWEPHSASYGVDQRQYQVYDITLFNSRDLIERHSIKMKHNEAKGNKNNEAKGNKNNEEGVLFYVVPLMSLSTFIREWEAIQCMKLPELMPLSSYIRNGTPIVSALLLMDMKGKLESRVDNLLKVSADFVKSKDAVTSRVIEKLRDAIIDDLQLLQRLPVDGSVIVAGGDIGKYISKLKKKPGMSGHHQEILDQCEVLKAYWMKVIKVMHKTSTISKLSGGNVVVIERGGKDGSVGSPGAGSIEAPRETPPLLWNTLTNTFNESQLYSIKHVCTRFTDERDTRIALLQGPPGTGKTSTILGMLSVFLSKKYNAEGVLKSESRTLTATSQANNNDTRILLCAPSNAALDELLLRILRDGIVNGKGVRTQVKIVRLGESQKVNNSTRNEKMNSTDNNTDGKNGGKDKTPTEPLKHATMADVARLALEEQIEMRVRTSTEYLENIKFDDKIRKSFASLKDMKRLEHSLGASEYKEKIRKIKGDLTKDRSSQRKVQKQLATRRYELRRDLLHNADIVASTCSSSGRHSFMNIVVQDNIAFQCCIIDEAAQTTEPSTLVPLKYGCANLVLVGDPRQLPATVLSNAASHAGLGMSLFERLEKCGHEVVMLNMQYRMHPILRAFPSLHFYKNQLEDAPYIQEEVQENSGDGDAMQMDGNGLTSPTSTISKVCILGPENEIVLPSASICQSPPQLSVSVLNFYNVNGQERNAGKSFVNEAEAHLCIWLANQLLCHFQGEKSIAIIAPYKAQVRYIAKVLDEISGAGDSNSKYGGGNGNNSHGGGYKTSSTLSVHSQFRDLVEVNTVDGFQGREKDMIIFTGVRTNPHGIGFVSDLRRLNVAITRAKGMLAIVGHTNLGKADKTWGAYIDHVSQQRRLIDVYNVKR